LIAVIEQRPVEDLFLWPGCTTEDLTGALVQVLQIGNQIRVDRQVFISKGLAGPIPQQKSPPGQVERSPWGADQLGPSNASEIKRSDHDTPEPPRRHGVRGARAFAQ